MPLVPELAELRQRLQEIGMVVVEEPDHLTVRLPYFCSVRIHLVDGCLRFEPFFGLVPRTRSTIIKLFLFTGITEAAFRAGVPFALGIAVIGIMMGIYDVVRTIATENVITRAGMIFTQLVHGDQSPRAVGARTTMRALDAGSMSSPTPAQVTRDELRVRREP